MTATARMHPATRRIPYREIILLAALATLGATVFVLIDLHNTRDTLGGLIGQDETPRHQILPWEEIGSEPTATGGPHDGRYFYAVARSLPNLRDAGPYLDRPAYRSQRILYPAISRVLHPVGNGSGLIWTMFAVGVFGVFLCGFTTGCMSVLLRGPTWPAVVPPLFYGSWVSLRISVPDPLAFGLALAAIVLTMRSRYRWAVLAAVAAVLTRETSLLYLVGFALWKRDRQSMVLVGAPVVAAGLWNLYVRTLSLPASSGPEVVEFTLPFTGLVDAVRWWASPQGEVLGALCVIPVLVLAVLALVKRSPAHPLWWMIAVQLALFVVLKIDVVGPERNGSRVALPILMLATVALVTPRAPRRADAGAGDAVAADSGTDAGTDAAGLAPGAPAT